jgi:chromosome segregation ATPase
MSVVSEAVELIALQEATLGRAEALEAALAACEAERSYSANRAEELEYLLATAKGERDEHRRRAEDLAELVGRYDRGRAAAIAENEDLLFRVDTLEGENAKLREQLASADERERQLIGMSDHIQSQRDALSELLAARELKVHQLDVDLHVAWDNNEGLLQDLNRAGLEKELLHAHFERELIKALTRP